MTKPYVVPKNKTTIQTRMNKDIVDTIFQSAIVDDLGNEIPITEKMIQDACDALEQEALLIYDSRFMSA
ncbi:MAG: PA1571 family protein [Pseudomonadales bacterium]